MCLVLFAVSKILDSSELLSCLLEMDVEYSLVCIREGRLGGKGVEPPRGRGRLSGARESQLLYVVTKVIGWIIQILQYVDISCNVAKMFLVIYIFPDLCSR